MQRHRQQATAAVRKRAQRSERAVAGHRQVPGCSAPSLHQWGYGGDEVCPKQRIAGWLAGPGLVPTAAPRQRAVPAKPSARHPGAACLCARCCQTAARLRTRTVAMMRDNVHIDRQKARHRQRVDPSGNRLSTGKQASSEASKETERDSDGARAGVAC